MKTLFTSICLAAGLLVGGVALAGDGGECDHSARHSDKKESRKAAAIERLALTDAQIPLFEEAMKSSHKARKAAMESATTQEERHAAMEGLRADLEDDLAEFLTPAQLDTFREMGDERQGKMEGKRDKMEARRAETIERLALTDAQLPQFEAVMKQAHEERRAAMQEARTSGERPDRSEMKAKHEALDAELATFLTAEQMEEWSDIREEMRAERREHKGGRGGHGGRGGQF